LAPARRAAFFLFCAICLLQGSARADEIGVLYALEADWRSLKGDGTASAHTINGTVVQTVRIGPHTVRGVQMGAGNVETAINASRLLARFPCDWVVSLGPAGGLRDEVPRGAVCIVKEVVAYQRGTWSGQGWSLATAARIATPIPSSAPVQASPWREAAAVSIASGEVPSPLAGKVVAVDVKVGQTVEANAQLLTLEAMKMNTYVFAPAAGTVEAILVQPGDAVEEGQGLVRIS
jgi:biotin carboxyl carrier protein